MTPINGDVMKNLVMTVYASISSFLRNVSCSRYRISHTFLGNDWIGCVICSSWKYRIPDRRLGMAAEKPQCCDFSAKHLTAA